MIGTEEIMWEAGDLVPYGVSVTVECADKYILKANSISGFACEGTIDEDPDSTNLFFGYAEPPSCIEDDSLRPTGNHISVKLVTHQSQLAQTCKNSWFAYSQLIKIVRVQLGYN